MAEPGDDAVRPGETVVWAGSSARGLTFNAFDGPLMALGGLLVLVGSGLVARGQVAVGIPVLLVGSYLLAGQLLYESQRRRRTRYLLTTDRAYLIHSWPRRRTEVIDLRRCGPSRLTIHRDGTGTVTFGRTWPIVAWIGPLRWSRPAFRYVADA